MKYFERIKKCYFFSFFKLNGDHIDVKGANCEPHDNDEENTENDVHFEPIISLPLIEVSNNEEDETEMLKL